MLPPSKEQSQGAREHPGGRQARPPWHSWRVLAERNQSVAPVGVWVESTPGAPEESLAFASAFQVEEELKEQQREKAARLRRFQREVKQRVNQQVRLRRKQQLQKCCEADERESYVATQYSGSMLRLTPRTNTCVFRSRPAAAICGPDAHAVPGVRCELFQQQAAKESKSCRTAVVSAEDGSEELFLAGHHDLPAELQDQGTAEPDDFYIKMEFAKRWDGSVKDSSSPEPPRGLHTDYQPPLALWAGVDQEETKKQRQNEYLRYRRLFMNIEREQVKEQERQRERQKRIAMIKSKKENQRRAEEQRMREVAEQQEPFPGEGPCDSPAQLQLEERRAKKVKEKQQRNKEYARYVEALRAQMREKIKLYNMDLPPLCSCGTDFWDSHPDTCANNCVFYKNQKAYSRALQSVLASCEPADRSAVAGRPLRDVAALCTRRGKQQ